VPEANECSAVGRWVEYRPVADLTVSVQAQPRDRESWLALARRVEAAGYHALLIGDHPADGAAPWPALGAAAAVTSTLRLGTYVLQAGVREPAHIAADAATLDLLAPGRVLVGLGAGHTPQEWQDLGRQRPSPGDRARRLVESVEIIARLLHGDTVDVVGRYVSANGAALTGLPVGPGRITLTVGGGHPDVLAVTAARADVVGLSGLGRTLPDGHHHEVRWSEQHLRTQLQLIRAEAERAGNFPAAELLVQHVIRTDDRAAVLDNLRARLPGTPTEDLATTPYLLIGTPEDMAAQIRRQAHQLGLTRYDIREPAIDHLEPALALLHH
jgi:probable F420-dependent oxidoreductase